MSEKTKVTDRRLLAALDYIDQKYIDDVFDLIKEPQAVSDPTAARRTPFKHWKQFVALAACLILLSAAFPAVVRFVSSISDFIAGRGSETTEEDSGIVIDTLDTTEEMETLTDMPETSESTDGMYDEYVLTEDDLAAINKAWEEKNGHIFADTLELAMWRVEGQGPFYYGKYGNCIVFATGGYMCAECEYLVGGYYFYFPTIFTIHVYYDENIYRINEAYDNGYLTDYHVKKLYEFHIQYYNHFGEYTEEATEEVIGSLTDMSETSQSTNGISDEHLLTEEDLTEINKAWEEQYGNIYTETLEFAMRRDTSQGPFYYGKYGDCIVFATGSYMRVECISVVGDYLFHFPAMFTIHVYYDGNIYPINEAYNNGYLTEYHVKELNKLHNQYFN